MTETQGSTATPERGRAEKPQQKSLIARAALFYRQVIAELRKVVWPTRQELITYTTVVIAFVMFVMSFVFVIDYFFSKAVLAVFG